jgi:hypothetical protein
MPSTRKETEMNIRMSGATSKLFPAKFPGKCGLSGREFAAGVEVCYFGDYGLCVAAEVQKHPWFDVTYAQCHEHEAHHFVTEASDLQLKGFPGKLTTDMGNKQPFYRTSVERDDEGDLVCANYRQEFGCITLRVYND